VFAFVVCGGLEGVKQSEKDARSRRRVRQGFPANQRGGVGPQELPHQVGQAQGVQLLFPAQRGAQGFHQIGARHKCDSRELRRRGKGREAAAGGECSSCAHRGNEQWAGDVLGRGTEDPKERKAGAG